MERNLRKYQNTLVISGTALIIFGVWSIMKAAFLLMIPNTSMTTLFPDLKGAARTAAQHTAIAAIFIALAVNLILRIYLGRTAIRKGRGDLPGVERRSTIVLSWVFVAGSVVTFIVIYELFFNSDMMLENLVTDFLVEVTSLTATIDLMRAAYHVRALEKAIAEQKTEDNSSSEADDHAD